MKRRRLKCLILSLSVILTVGAVGCGKKQNESAENTNVSTDTNTDPFYKYTETINLTAGVEVYDAAKKLPSGDTLENNGYTRYFQDKTNIKITNKFEAQFGDAYNQKVKLAVASNDLPDFMVVRDYSTFKQLVDFGLIEDLTPYYNKYASPRVKSIYEAADGVSLKQATFDGKIMALPEPSIQYDSVSLLWIRQDWLDKLKLQPPKTMDDVVNIAKVFMTQDPDGNGKADTSGLLGDKKLIFSDNNSWESIFASYHSYPQYWYKDSSGKVVYGSVTSETKTALAKLSELYKQGIIDKEFVVRKDSTEPVVAGKAGMMFSPWWSPWSMLGNSIKNDPKADWRAYPAPLDADGNFTTRMASPSNGFLVVKKGIKNPDAVIRYFNTCTDVSSVQKAKIYDGNSDLTEPYRLSAIGMVLDFPDAITSKNKFYNAVLEGKAKVGDKEDPNPAESQFNIDSINKDKAEPKKDITAWQQSAAYLIGGKPLTDNPIIKPLYGAYYGTTKTMETKWANLQKLENGTFLQIIMGNQDISSFDSFVEQWKKMGGDEITAEVQKEAQ